MHSTVLTYLIRIFKVSERCPKLVGRLATCCSQAMMVPSIHEEGKLPLKLRQKSPVENKKITLIIRIQKPCSLQVVEENMEWVKDLDVSP